MDVKQPKAADFKPFPDCWFETVPATFGRYLPESLANGAYKIAPTPLVINRRGLEGIQEAVDLMRVITEKGQEEVRETIARMEEDGEENRVSPIKLVVERP